MFTRKGSKSNSIRVTQCRAHVTAHTVTQREWEREKVKWDFVNLSAAPPLVTPGNGQLYYVGHVLQVLEFNTCQKSHKWHIILIRSQTMYR